MKEEAEIEEWLLHCWNEAEVTFHRQNSCRWRFTCQPMQLETPSLNAVFIDQQPT
jgi:hypothetical protein